MNKVAVVGSLNADLVVKAERLPRLGETISGLQFDTFPGGKGANQAVAAAKLGAEVVHVGCIGNDSFGKMLVGSLQQAGVETSFVQTVGDASTGVALITVDQNGDNTIVVVSGANGHCSASFVQQSLAQIEADVLLLQLEIPLEAVQAAAESARARNMTVVLNPAPARPLPETLLSAVDVLVLNETEAEALTGQPAGDRERAREAGKALLKKGIEQVIITLGKRGAYYLGSDGEVFVPAFSVQAVDTTAAGDAFAGGLAARIGTASGIREALEFASAAGALAVTRMGAQSSLPTAQEIQQFLQRSNRGAGS